MTTKALLLAVGMVCVTALVIAVLFISQGDDTPAQGQDFEFCPPRLRDC